MKAPNREARYRSALKLSRATTDVLRMLAKIAYGISGKPGEPLDFIEYPADKNAFVVREEAR